MLLGYLVKKTETYIYNLYCIWGTHIRLSIEKTILYVDKNNPQYRICPILLYFFLFCYGLILKLDHVSLKETQLTSLT